MVMGTSKGSSLFDEVDVVGSRDKLDGCADPLGSLDVFEQLRRLNASVGAGTVREVADREPPLGGAVAAVGDGVGRDGGRPRGYVAGHRTPTRGARGLHPRRIGPVRGR